MRLSKTIFLFVVLIAFSLSLNKGLAQNKIGSSEAKNNVGKTLTVCGLVASSRYLERSKEQPTFLNIGKAYPNQDLTVVIFGKDRSKFGTPENDFKDKRVCVTGKIELYKNEPQIVVKEKEQIKIEK